MEHRNIWKTVLCLMILACLLLALSACNKTSSQGNNDKIDGKKVNMKLENPNVTVMHIGSPDEDSAVYATEKLDQQYGGKVDFIQITANEIQTKLVTALNTGDIPDATYWGISEMPVMAIKGILQPVDEYFDVTSPIFNKKGMDQMRYKGKYYGVAVDSNVWTVFYNKNIFEENGVKTPGEYFKEGKWNFNAFLEVAQKLTIDVDRDGTVDIWGYTLGNPENFILANGTDVVNIQPDGIIKLNMDNQKLIDALQFIQDGIVKYKCFTPASGRAQQDFISGKLAMYTSQVTSGKNFTDMKYEWDFVPYPAGPGGIHGVSPGGSGHFGIPNGAKNPKGGAAWILLRSQYTYEHRNDRLIEFLNDEQISRVEEYRKDTVIALFRGIGNLTKLLQNSLIGPVRKGNSIQSTIESAIPVFQAEVDLLNKEIN